MELAHSLAVAVEALRRGDAASARPLLREVWEDPDLANAPDLLDIRARAGSLYAQALLEVGETSAADAVCRDALRLLRRLGDPDGVHQVRGVQDRIQAALVEAREQAQRSEEARIIAQTPLDELLAQAETPDDRAAVLVRKANALLDSGEEDSAADLAYRALDVARAHDIVTWNVFARLALLRAEPDHAQGHLHAAHAIAAEKGEFNLISAVARAAREHNLTLPVELGPHAGRGA